MFSKTNLIATAATALWSFFGGYLLWGIIGDPMLKNHLGSATGVMKDVPDFGILALGCLISAFLFVTIYSKWVKGSHSVTQGAQFGILIGAFIGLGDQLIDNAVSNLLVLSGTLLNAIIYFVFYIIMGIIASLVFNKFSSAS